MNLKEKVTEMETSLYTDRSHLQEKMRWTKATLERCIHDMRQWKDLTKMEGGDRRGIADPAMHRLEEVWGASSVHEFRQLERRLVALFKKLQRLVIMERKAA